MQSVLIPENNHQKPSFPWQSGIKKNKFLYKYGQGQNRETLQKAELQNYS